MVKEQKTLGTLGSSGSAANKGTSGSRLDRKEDAMHSSKLPDTLARRETRRISILRMAVMSALLLTTIIVSVGVFLYTRNEQQDNFHSVFEESASQVIDSFHGLVEKNLAAVASLSTDFTSYALLQKQTTNITFPFVTLPDFAQRGSHFRAQSGAFVLHWTPLVTDETRDAWELYASEHRGYIDEQFEIDSMARAQQDRDYGNTRRSLEMGTLDLILERTLEDNGASEAGNTTDKTGLSILEDGTGFHTKIWSNGAITVAGDEPEGSGPYLPTWQQR